MLKVITVTNRPDHATKLITSLKKHNWDFELIECEWKGFGTKLIETYNYLKKHPEVDRFIFCDAFDVVAMSGQEEFESKLTVPSAMLCSAERGLWPPILHPFKNAYSEFKHGFNYINSGLYYCPSEFFIGLIDKYQPEYHTDDQLWMNMVYLITQGQNMVVNHHQFIFNSHSFIHDGEYSYNNGRVQWMDDTEPVFLHLNGHTSDEKLNELLK
jgi:hypothetical protein